MSDSILKTGEELFGEDPTPVETVVEIPVEKVEAEVVQEEVPAVKSVKTPEEIVAQARKLTSLSAYTDTGKLDEKTEKLIDHAGTKIFNAAKISVMNNNRMIDMKLNTLAVLEADIFDEHTLDKMDFADKLRLRAELTKEVNGLMEANRKFIHTNAQDLREEIHHSGEVIAKVGYDVGLKDEMMEDTTFAATVKATLKILVEGYEQEHAPCNAGDEFIQDLNSNGLGELI